MGKILIEGMEFFAYHGCFREEQIIGTRFIVDLEVEVDTACAEQSDLLTDTINYQELYGLVRHEMEQKSKLLEHVARRILDSVQHAFPNLTSLQVKISKINPPLGGKVNQVTCIVNR